MGILDTNKLCASKTFEQYDEELGRNVISLTRDKRFNLKNPEWKALPIRIALDGDALSDRYKITPYSYFNRGEYKDNDASVRHGENSESEERIDLGPANKRVKDEIFGDEELVGIDKAIPNIDKYIKEICFDPSILERELAEFAGGFKPQGSITDELVKKGFLPESVKDDRGWCDGYEDKLYKKKGDEKERKNFVKQVGEYLKSRNSKVKVGKW